MRRERADQGEIGGPLAIVSGGGTLPFAIADAAMQRGRRAVLLALRGSADPARVADYPHHWISVGQFGRLCRLAQQEGCRDMVFIGRLVRPTIWVSCVSTSRRCACCRASPASFAAAMCLLQWHHNIFEERGFNVRRRARNRAAHPDAGRAVGPLSSGRGRPCRHRDAGSSFCGDQAVRRRTGGRGRAHPGAGCGGRRRHRPYACALRRASPRRPHSQTKGPAFWSRRRSTGRTGGSTCLRSDRETIESAITAGLTGIAVVAGSAIVAEPDPDRRRWPIVRICSSSVCVTRRRAMTELHRTQRLRCRNN